MREYHAIVKWVRQGAPFTDNRYSRAHLWLFDEGVQVPASASPHVVPLPLSQAAAVDPEEAFVAALSSCHMLWFLSLAAKQGFVADSYEDDAVGVMAKNPEGKLAMTQVTLRPAVRFAGERRPSAAELDALHHEAHEKCFIANSVKTQVRCEPKTEPALSSPQVAKRQRGPTISDVLLRRFDVPDETRQFEKGRFDVVRVGNMTIGRARYEPGWKWSQHNRPAAGTTTCEVEHLGLVLSGRCAVQMEGHEPVELRPGDLFYVPPRHDSWVVGDEPYVSLHFLGADAYARDAAASR